MLAKRIYGATKLFPKEEMYGLVQQMRRAGISVPSNIAEGYGRGGRKEYAHFLHTARGSLYELETQIFISRDLSYLTDRQADSLLEDADECSRILGGLIKSLKPGKL